MPELPEVETIVRQLRARGVEGCRIDSVRVLWHRTIEPLSVQSFSEALVGDAIVRLSRVGKWIIFSLRSGQSILIHLRMSGSFSLSPGNHDRVVLGLSGGLSLFFSDPRKFGRWKLVDDPDTIIGSLGPDALSGGFALDRFREELLRRQRKIKPLLLDQSIVAGLGNIYVDEALWEAGIHPERQCKSLSENETAALFRAIRHVLETGVENRGTSLGEGRSNYRDVEGVSGEHRAEVMAYGRTGLPCGRCGRGIERIVVGQRSTHFCPHCQKM